MTTTNTTNTNHDTVPNGPPSGTNAGDVGADVVTSSDDKMEAIGFKTTIRTRSVSAASTTAAGLVMRSVPSLGSNVVSTTSSTQHHNPFTIALATSTTGVSVDASIQQDASKTVSSIVVPTLSLDTSILETTRPSKRRSGGNEKAWEPDPNDVIYGNKKKHPGNKFYFSLVEANTPGYFDALRKRKYKIIDEIIDQVLSRGGRFLAKPTSKTTPPEELSIDQVFLKVRENLSRRARKRSLSSTTGTEEASVASNTVASCVGGASIGHSLAGEHPTPKRRRTTSTMFRAAARAGVKAAFASTGSVPDDEDGRRQQSTDESMTEESENKAPQTPQDKSPCSLSTISTVESNRSVVKGTLAITTPSAPVKAIKCYSAVAANSFTLPEGDLISRTSDWSSFERSVRSPLRLLDDSFDSDGHSFDLAVSLGYLDTPIGDPLVVNHATANNGGDGSDKDDGSCDLECSLMHGMLIATPTLGQYPSSSPSFRRVSDAAGKTERQPLKQVAAANYNLGQARSFSFNSSDCHPNQDHLKSLRVNLAPRYVEQVGNDDPSSLFSPKTKATLDAAFVPAETIQFDTSSFESEPMED